MSDDTRDTDASANKIVPKAPCDKHHKLYDKGKQRLVFKHRFDQRPAIVGEQTKRQICKLVAQGMYMKDVVRQEGIPPQHVIYDMIWRDPEFKQMYKAARMAAAEVWADKLRELASEASDLHGVPEKKSLAHVQAIRLQVDTDKWLLSKMLREEFGDDLSPKGGGGTATMLEIIKAVALLARTPAEPKPVMARVIVPEIEDSK
jgi:hypothetical protein